MTARVQNFKGQGSGVSSLTIAPTTSNVTVGNLLVVAALYGDDATTLSINDATLGAGKDSLGNVYTLAAAAALSSNPLDFTSDGDFLYVWYTVLTVGAAKPNIRLLASSGTHSIHGIGNEVSPTNVWTLDQSVTSHYNITSTAFAAGAQTPSSAAGYALVTYGALGGAGGLSMDSTFAVGLIETTDGFLITGDTIYSSTALLTPSATVSATQENGGILIVFKDASGGGGGGRLFRGAVDLDGLGGMGTKRFNPSL